MTHPTQRRDDGGVTNGGNDLLHNDRIRQVVVVIAEVFCVIGTLVGVGAFGTRVAETSGGALAADATLIAPFGPAFAIWTPIYIGLGGYAIWQALPAIRTDTRARMTGWLFAGSMVLNALWLLVTQQGWLWMSVVVIVALLITVLALVAAIASAPPRQNVVQVLLLDVTAGLYLGWVAVATCANITATLVAEGVQPNETLSTVLAVVVLGVAAAVVVQLSAWLRRESVLRWSVAGAAAWGLVWIAVGRTVDEPRSTVVAVFALLGAVAMVAAAARPSVVPGTEAHGRHA